VIEICPEYARLLLRRMASAENIKSVDTTFFRASYWCGAAGYWNESEQKEEWEDQGGNIVLDELENGTYLCNEWKDDDEKEARRVDCCTVNVTGHDVYWRAHIKHTGIVLETETVDKETLTAIAQELA